MPKPNTNKKITVRCFGKFEVLKDGVPLKFKREKAKELFAYLIEKTERCVLQGKFLLFYGKKTSLII